MIAKYLSRAVVIVAINAALVFAPFTLAYAQARSKASKPTPEKSSLPTRGQIDGALAGIIAGLVVGTVVVVYLLTRKQTVTGCVASGADGMTITDEKDQRTYSIAGDTVDVTPGHRIKLQGKKEKPQGPDKPYVWESQKVSKDSGACRP